MGSYVINQIQDNKNVTKHNKIQMNVYVATAPEMEKNMSEVKSVAETVATQLGYAKLKIEQKDVILSLYRGGTFS